MKTVLVVMLFVSGLYFAKATLQLILPIDRLNNTVAAKIQLYLFYFLVLFGFFLGGGGREFFFVLPFLLLLCTKLLAFE